MKRWRRLKRWWKRRALTANPPPEKTTLKIEIPVSKALLADTENRNYVAKVVADTASRLAHDATMQYEA